MKLYSIKEAAEVLGKSRQYIWLLIKMGRIKARQVGEQYVITQSELFRYKTDEDNSNQNKLLNNKPTTK